MSNSIRTPRRRLLAVAAASALIGSLLPGAALAYNHDSPASSGPDDSTYGDDTAYGDDGAYGDDPEDVDGGAYGDDPADTQATVTTRGVERVCPVAEPVTDAPDLGDVEGTTHAAAITCVVDYGFASGRDDGTFLPGQPITRGQAATIAVALIEGATDERLASPAESEFSDLGGTTHAGAIDKIAAAGVIQGRAGGVFGPNDTITRGAMARVITNSLDYIDTLAVDGSLPPANDTVFFADAVGSTFQPDIQALAGEGIVAGRTETTFAPAAQVTRGQMATFVMRAADYLDRVQRFAPTAEPVTFEVTLAGANEVSTDDGSLGAGEEDTTATSTITVDAFNRTIDFQLEFAEVTGPFSDSAGFHIHEGGLSENGPIVAFLATGSDVQAAQDDEDSVLTGTFVEADVDEDLEFRFADLIDDPDRFYLNLHSADFPPGAVRGQLPDGGQDLLEPRTFELTLTGAAEVGADGFEDGDATATVTVDAVNRTISHVTDISEVDGTFAGAPGYHIHVGADDANGPVVLFLATDEQLQAAADGDGLLDIEVDDVDAELLRLLLTEPENYYLNIHTTDFPAGAVRAQME